MILLNKAAPSTTLLLLLLLVAPTWALSPPTLSPISGLRYNVWAPLSSSSVAIASPSPAPAPAVVGEDETSVANTAKIEALRVEGLERIAKRRYMADAQRIMELKIEGQERIKRREEYASKYALAKKVQDLMDEGEERVRRKAEVAKQYEEMRAQVVEYEEVACGRDEEVVGAAAGGKPALQDLLMKRIPNSVLQNLMGK